MVVYNSSIIFSLMIPESDIYHHKMTLSIQNRHSKKNYIQFIYLDIFFLIKKKKIFTDKKNDKLEISKPY